MANSEWRYVQWNEESEEAVPVDGMLVNPFRGMDHEDMELKIKRFLQQTGFERNHERGTEFRKGAHLAISMGDQAFPGYHDPSDHFPPDLEWSDEEQRALRKEQSLRKLDKFKQPVKLYLLVACCSLGAAVQGWDETAVNQAQLFYPESFNIPSVLFDSCSSKSFSWRVGLLNSAPYLCCALIGCWLSDPVNRVFGRRGAIFIACFISCFTCLWQALVHTWVDMFIARFFLGFGIGIKSATIPIYASECTPRYIRGGLVMFWQMWTAFGIMLGYLAGVVFGSVDGDLKWRLIIGSPMIFPIIVCAYVYTLPESPRWLLAKARNGHLQYFERAYSSLISLRNSKVQASRDMFFTYHMLEQEELIRKRGRNRLLKLFTERRNRRALMASLIVMVFQQMCGVNVFEYYSSILFTQAGFRPQKALAVSAGFGTINFVFAIPAVFLIDSFGRRNLLLSTFPLLAIFQLFTGLGFLASDATTRKSIVTLGMYLFCLAYSLGEGPVPFVYSSESLPFYVRDLGMSLVTAVNWGFNFLLSITFPRFLCAFKREGALAYYAGWCVVGWFLILLFVPETKNLTLEQLDAVFEGRSRDYARYGLNQIRYCILVWLLRREGVKKPVALIIADPASRGGPSMPSRRRLHPTEKSSVTHVLQSANRSSSAASIGSSEEHGSHV